MLQDVLENEGWAELDPFPSSADLLSAFDVLTTLRAGGKPDPASFPENPTLLQFYSDLFSFGSNDSSSESDVLVSFLDDANGRQTYFSYTSDGVADVEYFFDEIYSSPALIFCGRFREPKAGWNAGTKYRIATKRRLFAVNAICVDVDTERSVLERIDDETLSSLLSRLPAGLLPSYISLSGHGVHLWYVFEKALQACREYEPKRKKINALAHGVYSAVSSSIEGLPLVADPFCASPTHAFRAPGSLTKERDVVRCFCRKSNLFSSPFVDPVGLAGACSDFMPDVGLLIGPGDLVWESEAELREAARKRHEEYMSSPATAAQISAVESLMLSGKTELPAGTDISSITKPQATQIIGEARSAAYYGNAQLERLPIRPTWTTKPHFIFGDGVYRTILKSITQVAPGRRELSMFMLAGVAFMTAKPEIPRERLRGDLERLLATKWAQASSPITQHDIDSAMSGYCRENWRTRASIVETLGFDPFEPSAKRNGRSRQEHVNEVLQPAHRDFADKRAERILEEIRSIRQRCQGISQREVACQTGYSRTTVRKYWEA